MSHVTSALTGTGVLVIHVPESVAGRYYSMAHPVEKLTSSDLEAYFESIGVSDPDERVEYQGRLDKVLIKVDLPASCRSYAKTAIAIVPSFKQRCSGLIWSHFCRPAKLSVKAEITAAGFELYVTDIHAPRRRACRAALTPLLSRRFRSSIPTDVRRYMAHIVWISGRFDDQWDKVAEEIGDKRMKIEGE